MSAAKASKRSVLRLLLGERSVEQFFREHHDQAALVLRGKPARFDGLFDRDAFGRACGRCDALRAVRPGPTGVQLETPISPQGIQSAYARGDTICVSGIKSEPTLARFLTGFAAELLHAGEPSFNAYLSPDGAGFGLHLDDHPVWILQVSGEKLWRFSAEPGLAHPLTSVSFATEQRWSTHLGQRVPRPDEAAFKEAKLGPGDALYLPPGTWHRAKAVGHSLALTLAVAPAGPLEAVRSALLAQVAAVPELRVDLPGLWAEQVRDEAPAAILDRFERTLETLRERLEQLTPEDLYATWLSEARAHGRPCDDETTDPEAP